MTESPSGQSVLDMIRVIVTTLVDVSPRKIVPAAKWDDILADRFDFYGVLSDTQRQFGIEIPDDDGFKMETVGDLIVFVESKGL
jgi:acyl carrier protein